MKILIVEDDSTIVELVSLCLRVSWPDAQIFYAGLAEEGMDVVEQENPELVILDLGLPDRSGLELLKDIRRISTVPVIILTVRDDEADVVRGLELGADDYVTKPFRQMEFVSRAKALLRRHKAGDSSLPVTIGPFQFSASRRQVTAGDRSVKLTATEGKMLYLLAQNRGKAVSHDAISNSIWGERIPDAANSIRVHMRNLRQKLKKIDMGDIIATRSGAGYLMKK